MILVDLILLLNEIVGKYGIGCIDYVENCLVGIKLCEIYECFVVMVLLVVYKEIEDLILVCEVFYFKFIFENELLNFIYNVLWFSLVIKVIIVYVKEI